MDYKEKCEEMLASKYLINFYAWMVDCLTEDNKMNLEMVKSQLQIVDGTEATLPWPRTLGMRFTPVPYSIWRKIKGDHVSIIGVDGDSESSLHFLIKIKTREG